MPTFESLPPDAGAPDTSALPLIDPPSEKELLEQATLREYEALATRFLEDESSLSDSEKSRLIELDNAYKDLRQTHSARGSDFGAGLQRGLYYQPAAAFAEASEGIPVLEDLLGGRERRQRIERRMELPDLAPSDSAGDFLGQVAGSIVPSAAALAATAFSGGSAAPAAAALFYGIQGFGTGRQAYHDYHESTGQEGSLAGELGTGVAFGVIETLAERLGLEAVGRIGVDSMEKIGRRLIGIAADNDPSIARAVARLATMSAGAEGAEEAITQLGQNIVQQLYNADQETLEGVADAFIGGAAGGLMLAPVAGGVGRVRFNRAERELTERYGGTYSRQQDGEEAPSTFNVRVSPVRDGDSFAQDRLRFDVQDMGGQTVASGTAGVTDLEGRLYDQGFRRGDRNYIDIRQEDLTPEVIEREVARVQASPIPDDQTVFRIIRRDGRPVPGRGLETFRATALAMLNDGGSTPPRMKSQVPSFDFGEAQSLADLSDDQISALGMGSREDITKSVDKYLRTVDTGFTDGRPENVRVDEIRELYEALTDFGDAQTLKDLDNAQVTALGFKAKKHVINAVNHNLRNRRTGFAKNEEDVSVDELRRLVEIRRTQPVETPEAAASGDGQDGGDGLPFATPSGDGATTPVTPTTRTPDEVSTRGGNASGSGAAAGISSAVPAATPANQGTAAPTRPVSGDGGRAGAAGSAESVPEIVQPARKSSRGGLTWTFQRGMYDSVLMNFADEEQRDLYELYSKFKSRTSGRDIPQSEGRRREAKYRALRDRLIQNYGGDESTLLQAAKREYDHIRKQVNALPKYSESQQEINLTRAAQSPEAPDGAQQTGSLPEGPNQVVAGGSEAGSAASVVSESAASARPGDGESDQAGGDGTADSSNVAITAGSEEVSGETQAPRLTEGESLPEGQAQLERIDETFQGSPEDYLEVVAREGTDPLEIAEAYRTAQMLRRPGDPVEEAIADFLRSGGRFSTRSYDEFGDPEIRKQDRAIVMNYLGGQTPLDVAAQSIMMETGLEVTPETIVTFLNTYRKGVWEYDRSLEAPIARELAERFREVTGEELTPEALDRVLDAYESSLPPVADDLPQRLMQELVNAGYATGDPPTGDGTSPIDLQRLWNEQLQNDQGRNGLFFGFSDAEYALIKSEAELQLGQAGQLGAAAEAEQQGPAGGEERVDGPANEPAADTEPATGGDPLAGDTIDVEETDLGANELSVPSLIERAIAIKADGFARMIQDAVRKDPSMDNPRQLAYWDGLLSGMEAQFHVQNRGHAQGEAASQASILPGKNQEGKASSYIANLLHKHGLQDKVASEDNFHVHILKPGFDRLNIERQGDLLYVGYWFERWDDLLHDGELVFRIRQGRIDLVEVASSQGAPMGERRLNPSAPGAKGFAEVLAKIIFHQAKDGRVVDRNAPESVDNHVDAVIKTDDSLAGRLLAALKDGSAPQNNRELNEFIADFHGKAVGRLTQHEKKEAQESMEHALVEYGRFLIASGRSRGLSDREIFQTLVETYDRQPRLNIRTSGSIDRQAYSTPLPLAFVASRLAQIDGADRVYEPTAGNGALLIEANPRHVTAVELDEGRSAVLRKQGIDAITADATEIVTVGNVSAKSQDVVIMNPPFGSLGTSSGMMVSGVVVEDAKVGAIDHQIVVDALGAMKDDGRAVLIIGADKANVGGTNSLDKPFFNWLYRNYRVVTHFEVSGDLYRRQGAGWPVRVIVIDGRGRSPFMREGERGITISRHVTQRAKTWNEVFDLYEQHRRANSAENRRDSNPDLGATQPDAEQSGVRGGSAGARAGDAAQPSPLPGVADSGTDRAGASAAGGRAVQGIPPGTQSGGASEQPGTGARGEQPDGARPQPDRVGSGRVTRPAGEQGDRSGISQRDLRGDDAPAPAGSTVAPSTSGSSYGASNTLVTREKYEEIRRRLLEKQGRASSGIDPEMIWLGTQAAVFHIEAGARRFADYARAMIGDFGDWVKPYLPMWYVAAKRYPGLNAEGMDLEADVDRMAADGTLERIQSQLEQNEKPHPEPVAEELVEDEEGNEYQTEYQTRSSGRNEDVLIPVNLAMPTHEALDTLREEVGDLDAYVMDELGYDSLEDLHRAFMGLQIDGVASAIYQIKRGRGVIIGDQTGVGKGRQVAGIIRWAIRNGYTPVFFTAKKKLFSDMYRDLTDIGTDARPQIINAEGAIQLPSGERLFANTGNAYNDTLKSMEATGALPAGRNMVMINYSQINRENRQRRILRKLARNSIIILDEAHNAAGESNTGEFMRSILRDAAGVAYVSATFAKRPDNMPLYFRTDMLDATGGSVEELTEALNNGGPQLQAINTYLLAQSGQFLRRERSFRGIEFRRHVDESRKEIDTAQADAITDVLRKIVHVDELFHDLVNDAERMEEILGKSGVTVKLAGNDASSGVDHALFTSIVHNLVKQMLLGIKVDLAADEAAEAIARGEKVVIALENTMESFLDDYREENNLNDGDLIGKFDFRDVLRRALKRTRRVRVINEDGETSEVILPLDILPPGIASAYRRIERYIDRLKTDIPGSPIDYIRARLTERGITVGEISGRKFMIDYTTPEARLVRRSAEEMNRDSLVNSFNEIVGEGTSPGEGEFQVVIMNRAGAEGLSMHASERFRNQRRRHMIVLQSDPDISMFTQMAGRINRTGQVETRVDENGNVVSNLPRYTLLHSAIPAEIRPAAVLAKKLKLLNANTSSNTESASDFDTPDLINKYGDLIVEQYLQENPDFAAKIGLSASESDGELRPEDGKATKVTGRVALLPVKEQEDFYTEVIQRYRDLISYLNETGQNDLKTRTLDFDAIPESTFTLVDGSDPKSVFGGDAVYGVYSIKRQGKTPTPAEVMEEIDSNLDGRSPEEFVAEIKNHLDSLLQSFLALYDQEIADLKSQYEGIPEAEAGALISQAVDVEERRDKIRRHAGDVRGVLSWFEPGKAFKLNIDGEEMQGVVTNLRTTAKEGARGNPYAPSKINVTFMLNRGIRRVTIPLSQLVRFGAKSGDIEYRDIVTFPWPDTNYRNLSGFLKPYFENVNDTGREKVRIVTGNLLAAFTTVKKGRIAGFTTREGQIKQGIILPANFNLAEALNQEINMRYSGAVMELLEAHLNNTALHDPGIHTSDGSLWIKPFGDGIRLSGIRLYSKGTGNSSKGTKWRRDETLSSIVGEWVSRGSDMETDILRGETAMQALDHILSKTALFAPKEVASQARDLRKKHNPNWEGESESNIPSQEELFRMSYPNVFAMRHEIGSSYGGGTTNIFVETDRKDDFQKVFDFVWEGLKNSGDKRKRPQLSGQPITYGSNRGMTQYWLPSDVVEAMEPILKALPEGEAPRYSLAPQDFHGQGMSAVEAASALQGFFTHIPVETHVELIEALEQLPRHIQQDLEKRKAAGRVRAVFDPNSGTLYVVTRNLPKGQGSAFRAMMHEVVGHMGVRGLLGEEIDPLFSDIAKDNTFRKDLRRIAETYGLDLSREEDRRYAVEEKIAELAESGADASTLDRVINAFRGWLRRTGIRRSYTERELRQIVSDARRYVLKGGKLTPSPMKVHGDVSDDELEDMSGSELLQYALAPSVSREEMVRRLDRATDMLKRSGVNSLRRRIFTGTVRRLRLRADELRADAVATGDERKREAADLITRVADMLFAGPEQRGVSKTYQEARMMAAAPYMDRLVKLIGIARSEARAEGDRPSLIRRIREGNVSTLPSEVVERLERAVDDVRVGDLHDPLAQELKRLLDDVGAYLVDAGVLELRELRERYFPRLYDKHKIERDQEGFKAAVAEGLRAKGVGSLEADTAAEHVLNMVLHGNEEGLRRWLARNRSATIRNTVRLGPEGRPWYINNRTLDIEDHFIRDYLNNNPAEVMTQYIMRAASHAEFVRRLGTDGGREIIKKIQEGASPQDAQLVADILDAHKGVYEVGSLPELQRAGSFIQNVIAVTSLAFAGLSSLGEFGTPILRAGLGAGMKGLRSGISSYFRHAAKGEEDDNYRFAQEIGAMMNGAVESLLQQYLYGFDKPLSKWMVYYYKVTLLEPITTMQRGAAVAAGRYRVKELLDAPVEMSEADKRDAERLNLPTEYTERQAMLRWIEKFEAVQGDDREALKGGEYGSMYDRYATSVLRLANETVVMANASNKPLYGSSHNPFKMLANQLQGFQQAFREGPLAYLIDEGWDERNLAVLLRILPLLVLHFIAQEVRRMIQFAGDPELAARVAREESGAERVFDLVSGSGLLGTASRVTSILQSDDYGIDPVIYGQGAAASRLSEGVKAVGALLDGDERAMSRFLTKHIPIAGQVRPVRTPIEEIFNPTLDFLTKFLEP